MLEIVTHCYSAEPVPIYHKLLALQLNSLFSCNAGYNTMVLGERPFTRITICYTEEDLLTSSVIKKAKQVKSKWIEINPMPLTKPDLFRRAIGRNKAALITEADVIWFTDCDHLMRTGTIRAALQFGKEISEDGPQMIHPMYVQINKNHSLGDYLLEGALGCPWGEFQIPSQDFQPRREKKAIGGLQIVSGRWAREKGYLSGTKWVERPYGAEHFLQCKCDVPYRKEICGGSIAKDIPGIFRVRHSRAGRDQGQKDHGA